MSEPCERCPCKEACLGHRGRPYYCDWAADDAHPMRGIRLRNICDASARVLGLVEPAAPVLLPGFMGRYEVVSPARDESPTGARAASTPCRDGDARVPVSEAVALLKIVKKCPHRRSEGCGCSGAICDARGGKFVSHDDCFACVRAGTIRSNSTPDTSASENLST